MINFLPSIKSKNSSTKINKNKKQIANTKIEPTDDEIQKLNDLDVIVLNALRVEPHHSHLNLDEAIQLSQKIGAKTTYFTHISHHLGFYAEVNQNLPKNVHLAYDNLTITI